MSKALYHFTAHRFVKDIQYEGLTRGHMLASINPLRLLPGYQWLTSNPSFDQEWAIGSGRLPYKRNEVRFTVRVPAHMKHNLIPWTRAQFLVPEVAADLSAFGDPDNWWVYEGVVLRGWLRDLTVNPVTTEQHTVNTVIKKAGAP